MVEKNNLSLAKCLVCSSCYTRYTLYTLQCSYHRRISKGKRKETKVTQRLSLGSLEDKNTNNQMWTGMGGNLVTEIIEGFWKCVVYGGIETIHATWNQIIANPTQNYLLWMVIGSNSELQCFVETRGLKNKLWKLFRFQELEDRIKKRGNRMEGAVTNSELTASSKTFSWIYLLKFIII